MAVGRIFLLVAAILVADAEASPIIREPGVIYLSDFAEKPMRLRLVRAAPCFFDTSMSRYAGTLRFPQTVQVLAFGDKVCRVRGNAQQGGVAAWLPYEELEPLPEGFLDDLAKAEERRRAVETLITQREVALGMTEDEVLRSVGRPQKRSKRADKEGVRQVWEYIRYQLVPQTTYSPGFTQTIVPIPGQTNAPGGMIVTGSTGFQASTIYVKVPVGTLSIAFADGVVETMDSTEGTLVGTGQVSVVAPPLNVYW